MTSTVGIAAQAQGQRRRPCLAAVAMQQRSVAPQLATTWSSAGSRRAHRRFFRGAGTSLHATYKTNSKHCSAPSSPETGTHAAHVYRQINHLTILCMFLPYYGMYGIVCMHVCMMYVRIIIIL
jgi:hypothetical protein